MATDDPIDPLVPVPIPALVVILYNLEKKKGFPLTKAEVIEARDNAVCMMMPISVRDKMAVGRGYVDVCTEDPWPQWQTIRTSLRNQRDD